MKQELDEALCKDFPLLFKDRSGDMRNTCMVWGFECGDGWEPLIRRAAEKIEPLIVKTIKENPDEQDFIPCASQVKEKYGTLRFYMNCATEEMYDAINEAEEESERTCETCGEPGKTRGGGWIRTLCDKHATEKGR